MYAVLGANGRAGGETARALVERGEAVRVVLRNKEQGERWRARGAAVAVAPIEDADAMADALGGVSGAFVLNPPPVRGDPFLQTEELGTVLATAVRRARLPKVVVLSSIGAQHVAGTGVIATLNRFEALLDGAAPATAVLRSGYFVETWSEVAEAVLSGNVLPTFLDPAQKIPMVSTRDVGRAAAALLGEQWTGRRIVELSGPDDWSAGDVAAAFSAVLGHPIVPDLVPPGQRAAVLTGEGVPDAVANALAGMYEGIANGLFMHESGNEQRRGVTPLVLAIEQVVAAARAARRQSLAGPHVA